MRIFRLLGRLTVYLAMLVVAAMMLLTVSDVTMRYIFNQPIAGTIEIMEYLMVCLLLGMAVCALERRHIKVDIVKERLPQKAQAIIEIVTLLAGLGLVGILAWQGFEAGLFALDYNVRSSMLAVPNFPFYVVLAVAFAALFISMVTLIIQKFGELTKR